MQYCAAAQKVTEDPAVGQQVTRKKMDSTLNKHFVENDSSPADARALQGREMEGMTGDGKAVMRKLVQKIGSVERGMFQL